jgi:hypothetical protein
MLKRVISQLNKTQFAELRDELAGNRAEKFSQLLDLYRETKLEDGKIREEINVTQAAFYTLKSRLFDKVQQYLFRTASDNRAELLKNISSIPYLIYNTPRETAISLLEHLETELKKQDMPAELVSVYNALKKLHLHTEHFYHYQQLYNKNVAYTLALDKADELVSSFTRELGDFLLSRDVSKLELLKLYLQQLNNISKLYDSHRLKVNRVIVSVSYALFADEKNEIPQTDETIEDLLKEFKLILDEHPEDRNYRFLGQIWHFLTFEYYHQLKLHKNGKASFEKTDASLETFLLLSHSCPATHFLLSKIEHLQISAGTNPEENEQIIFKSDYSDIYSSVNVALYLSATNFYAKKYSEAAACLNNLINEVSFKNFPFTEFQVKLFLSLNLLLAGKIEQAEITVRSVSRKLSSPEFSEKMPAANLFSRFLKVALNDNSATKLKKLETELSAFSQANKNSDAILRFIHFKPEHLELLSK